MAKGIARGMFPEEKRIEAATVYAVTGSLQRASELSGVPIQTLRSWRAQDDFQSILKEVWQENNEKIDAKFTEIIEKSLVAIIDRLDNGDFRLTSRGELKRVPIAAKELSLVQAINVDKRQLLRGLPTSRADAGNAVSQKTVEQLERLAQTFENLAKLGRKSKSDVEDAIIISDAKIEPLRIGSGITTVSTPPSHEEGQNPEGVECQAVQTTSETTSTSI